MTWGLPILVGVGCYLWWRRRTWTTPAQDEQRAVGARRPWRTAAEAWDRLERPFDAAYARYRQTEAKLAVRYLAHGLRLLSVSPTRRRIRSGLSLFAATSSCSPSAAASAWRNRSTDCGTEGATFSGCLASPDPREVEVLALVAEGAPTDRSARRCSSLPRPPASTSQRSWPSWGWPVAARRPRSPTDSASTSDDPRRPWLRFLGVAADAAGQSATSSRQSRWQRRPPSLPRFCYLLLAWPR